jgi:Tol biopolymer transport system component
MAAVLAMGSTVLGATAAQAAFPGANGQIVFAAQGFGGSRFCWNSSHDQLFTLTPGGSNPVQLTCTRGRDQHPSVSPVGTQVVFSSVNDDGPAQLFTLPLQSTGHRRFVGPTSVSDAPQASDDYPSWSPSNDGTIVFQRTLPGALSQIFTENVSDPSSATPVFPSPTGFADTEPVIDPSQPDLLAFVRDVGGHTHIFSYDTTTQTLTDLSAQGNGGGSGNDSKPDFAPSGAGGLIVFQSDRACGYPQLYTMTVQGTDQVAVFPTTSHQTSTGTQQCSDESSDPVFSPDGNELAFVRPSRFGTHESARSNDYGGYGGGGTGGGGGGGDGDGDGDDGGGGDGGPRLLVVSVNSSGGAVGAVTWVRSGGAQPNWGPATAPPAQTPEAPLPVVLPVVGAGVGAAAVFIRRKWFKRGRLATTE